MREEEHGSLRSGFAGLLVLLLGACSGDDGAPGPAGPPGIGVTNSATSLNVTIDAVEISSPPVVRFSVVNEAGIPFVGITTSTARFTIAKLVPGSNGAPSRWQNYINRTENPGVGPGTQSTIQATTENNGTLTDHGDGTYSYTFATDVTSVTSPLAVPYEPGLTHRLAIQVSGGGVPVANAIYTWRPSDGATSGLPGRDIVQTASCNECHGRLALHGGGRIDTKYCVLCHNPGSTDANSGNTVDFKVMIHKIHRGANLPSVEAGGEYAIYGFGGSRHDYSAVVLPQDIRNCVKCHDATDAATPQAGQWESMPSVEACGSCHDDVNFATGEGHSSEEFVASNGQCTTCHSDSGFAGSVADAHALPAKAARARYKFNILDVTATGPGEFPVITYSVTDPTNGNAAYDVKNDPKVASLTLLVGWNTGDYHNEGNTAHGPTSAPASAFSLNGRAASTGNNAEPVDNGDGTFTVTSMRPIPAGETGSGVVAMTGRTAEPEFSDRILVKSEVKFFAITDAEAVPRRDVVDIAKCNQCHDQLSLHGGSRNDEPQVCVICHNADNTDIAQRMENGGNASNIWPPPDGKVEESIDFKRMIHGIHAAAFRDNPLVIYGFSQSTHVFDTEHVHFPGILSNCNTCHVDESFAVPLAETAMATTLDSGASRPDHSDDVNLTPTAAVCSSCHDSGLAQTHMEQNGASFAMSGDPGVYDETCAVCHGEGRLADVAEIHAVGP